MGKVYMRNEMVAYMFMLEALEYPLIFFTNDDLVEKWLEINLAPYLIKLDKQGNDKDYYVYIYNNQQGLFDVLTPDFNLLINLDKIEEFLQKLINCKCVLKENYYFLHCALVEKCEKNIILIGASGSGKSTLTAFLHCNNFSCISDDKLIVNTKNGKIYPFIRNVQLRNGSLNILRTYGIKNVKYNQVKLYTYDREELIIQNRNYKQKINIGIQLDLRTDFDGCIIEKLDFFSTFQLILFNGYISNDIKQKIKPSIEIAKMISCYKMTYNDLKIACNELENLVNE